MENYIIWFKGEYFVNGESHCIPSLASDTITISNDETARVTAKDLSKNFEKKLFNQIKGHHPSVKLKDLVYKVVIQSLRKDISLEN